MREWMNIVEVEIGGGLDDEIPDVDGMDLSSDQLDLFSKVPQGEPKLPNFMKYVGRMGEYHVAERIYPDQNNAKVRKAGTFVFINQYGDAVSYIALKDYSRESLNYPSHISYKPELSGVGLRVGAVLVKPPFRGKNLGVEMYVWVLTNVCDYLMADELQTPEGVRLWKKLKRDPRLVVEVWDGDQYHSRNRRSGRDFNYVYDTSHLIPWVTLKSKYSEVTEYE